MTVVGSAEITVDLLDSSYQQKKRAIAIDLIGLEQKRTITVDLDSQAYEAKRSKIQDSLNDLNANRDLVDVTRFYANRNITQSQYEQESYEIAQRAASNRVAIAEAESQRLAIALEKVRIPGNVPTVVTAPNFAGQYAEARSVIEREQKLFNERRKSFEQDISKGLSVDRYEYDKAQSVSSARITGAKVTIEDLDRRALLSASQINLQAKVKLEAQKNNPEFEEVLVNQLIAAQTVASKAKLEIERNRIKREAQLRQETFEYYKAASKSVADVVVTGLEAEIGASNRRLSALSVTNEQLKLTRTAFEQQSTAQRTAIGLMEQYADVALRQSKELQNLSALSKTTVGSTPLVRREIVTQLTELTGKSNFADLRLPGLNADQSLLVRRQQQEDAIAQTQAAALDAQLNQKRSGLQLDIQSQEIAQARAKQEARVMLLRAEQNKVTARQQLFEAELAVETLPSNASERDRIVARNRFNNAQAQFNLADQGVGLATNALNATGVYAQIQQQISKQLLADFGVESKANRQLFNLKDAARERGQSLELATQGIDPRRFNRRSPGLEVGDRTQLLTGLDRSGGALQNQAAVVGIGQLVTIAQQTYLQNRQMLSELQVIATRSPVTLVGNEPVPSRVLRDNKL